MFHPLPAPQDTDHPDLFPSQPPFRQHAQGRHHRDARGNHRIEYVDDIGRDGFREFRVVFDRLEGGFIAKEAEVEDGGVGEEV